MGASTMTRYLLAASAIGLISTAASAQVTNGGFEAPVISGPCCNTVPTDSLPGWGVTVGNVNVVNGMFNGTSSPGPNLAYELNQYLDLVGQGGTGGISQSLTLTPGQAYNLTFAYSNNGFAPNESTSASAAFSIDGLAGTVSHSTANSTESRLADFHRHIRGGWNRHSELHKSHGWPERGYPAGRYLRRRSARTRHLGDDATWVRRHGSGHAPAPLGSCTATSRLVSTKFELPPRTGGTG